MRVSTVRSTANIAGLSVQERNVTMSRLARRLLSLRPFCRAWSCQLPDASISATKPHSRCLQVDSLCAARGNPGPPRARGSHVCAAIAELEAEVAAKKLQNDGYDAQHIQVLEGLEPVRKRPGMYIGSTGQRGLHHLLFEILDNSIDEVQAGHASHIKVAMDLGTGWVTVTDNGRGVPTDVHPATGKSALETVLTVLHAGGKFGGAESGYSVSGGLHGVGMSVVNALSQELRVAVWRRGRQYQQAFARGLPQGEMVETASSDLDRRGTEVQFLYDPQVFSKSATYDPDIIRLRLRELAFLNSRAVIEFAVTPARSETPRGDKAGGNGAGVPAAAPEPIVEVLHYSGGLAEYVAWLNRDKHPLHAPVSFSKMVGEVEVSVALQWCADAYTDTLVGFANSIKTIDGGTHMDGLKSAVTRTLNALARKCGVLTMETPSC